MKTIFPFLLLLFIVAGVHAQTADTVALSRSLEKATAAIREAFEKGDAEMIGRLHSVDVIKYFGGNNVISGRAAVEQGAKDWFRTARVSFIENTIENTTFTGNIAIQTVIFSIKTTPKNGGTPTIARGRSMVIYIQDNNSPTGWLTLREIAQEAPPEKK